MIIQIFRKAYMFGKPADLVEQAQIVQNGAFHLAKEIIGKDTVLLLASEAHRLNTELGFSNQQLLNALNKIMEEKNG